MASVKAGIHNKHLIVGVLKRKDESHKINYKTFEGEGNCIEYEIVKPFKRFTEFSEEHGHMKGLLTMLKVATDTNITLYDFNCIPVNQNKYYVDLDMYCAQINDFHNSPENYKLNAVLIPCGEV